MRRSSLESCLLDNVRFGLLAPIAAALAAAVFSTAAGAATISGTVSLGGQAAGSADVSRAVVYLDADPALASPVKPNEPRPQIAQQGKAFKPDLLVIVQGTTVEFPNWDPYAHNVFSRSAAASFDLDRYPQGQSKSYTFNTPGVVQIFCNIHPQMRAVVLVVPNRFFTRVDAQGRFALKEVPPGRWTVIGWDPRGGEGRTPIELSAAGLREVPITLAAAGVRDAAAEESAGPAARGSSGPPGVARGLGVKREQLNLPVVGDAHAAPPPQQGQ